MKRRFVRAVLASLAVGGVAVGAASAADAQEIQLTGPLKGAPAVRHLRLYREGRFEIAPTVSFTLLDEYRRTILVGARAQLQHHRLARDRRLGRVRRRQHDDRPDRRDRRRPRRATR